MPAICDETSSVNLLNDPLPPQRTNLFRGSTDCPSERRVENECHRIFPALTIVDDETSIVRVENVIAIRPAHGRRHVPVLIVVSS